MSARLLLLGLLLLLGPGCYLGHLAKGQLSILCGRVPIEEVIAEGDRPWVELEKLRLVLAARRFAIDHCGLEETDAYTTFYETEGPYVVWNLSGSEPDAFAAYWWSFPIVGDVPYLGFFRREPALEEQKALAAEGLDTAVLPVVAYSTLGWFDDPFYSGLLRENGADIVATVIHEMTHTTVYAPGQTDWNENMATFVGNEGARRFFLARGGPEDPGIAALGSNALADAAYVSSVRAMRSQLWRVFESSGPRAEKLALKAGLLESARQALGWKEPPNNAHLLMATRYLGDQELFAEVLHGCGNDLPAMIGVLKELAKEEDPRAATAAWAKGEPLPDD